MIFREVSGPPGQSLLCVGDEGQVAFLVLSLVMEANKPDLMRTSCRLEFAYGKHPPYLSVEHEIFKEGAEPCSTSMEIRSWALGPGMSRLIIFLPAAIQSIPCFPL